MQKLDLPERLRRWQEMQDALRIQERTQERGDRTKLFPTKEEVQRELKNPSRSGAASAESQEMSSETVLTWKEALAAARMEGSGQQAATSSPLTDTFG